MRNLSVAARGGSRPGPGPAQLWVGDADAVVGGGDGDWDAPFWTKIVTVVPLGAVLFAFGC